MKAKKFLCAALSVVLALGMSPTAALASTTGGSSSDETGAAPVQLEGAPGVDYAEGEVLVAVRGGVSALQEETATSVLAQAFGAPANEAGSSAFTVGESLASVSVDDIAAAAGDVGATGEVNLSAGSGDATLASTDADDVEIIVLKCDDVAQTIADLRSLDCVVVAQPNYLYSLIDDEGTDEEAASALASAVQGDSSAVNANAAADESATLSTSSAESDETAALASSTSESVATATLANAPAATDSGVSAGTSEPFYSAQWSLQSSESLEANGYSGTTGMDVEGAWADGAGDEEGGDVVVAVIDAGVDYTHEDLSDNMWTGGEAAWSTALGGGKYGLNTSEDGESDDPMDTETGHGTHVASTIAAAWNGTGIAGVNNKVDIMAIRFIPGGTDGAICDYNYIITAKENGVNVVAANNSWGPSCNSNYDDTLLDAIIYKAGTEGIISVFAAGNDGGDNDLLDGYQHSNSNPYLLKVGALDSSSEKVSWSHYGKLSVDVFSPGTEVLAAVTSYGAKTGASIVYDGVYLPWLKGSAGNASEYFLDDAEDASGPDGITYDLVSVTGNSEINHVGDVSICEKGYDNEGVNNGQSLKFSLKDAEEAIGDGLTAAIRITIPAATWDSYKAMGKGDDLYLSCIGGIAGTRYDDAYLKTYVRTGTGWEKLSGALNASWDFNWYGMMAKTSLSKVDAGKGDNGDVTVLLMVYGINKTADGFKKTEFTDEDFVYIDNVSLGWAASFGTGTSDADGTYYYNNGTSMAAPNTTGSLSLLCSHAAAASGDADYLQSAETARDIVSFVKGGVTQLDSLSDLCSTGGATDAATSYSAYADYLAAETESEELAATAELKPVSDSIADNGDGTSTLSGSFFGAEEGAVTFGDAQLEVTEWTDSAITFKSLSYYKEQVRKVVVTKANGLNGQGYLVLPAGKSSTEGFATLPTPDFDVSLDFTYGTDQTVTIEANASEVIPFSMAAADGYVYVFGVFTNNMPFLMRYDTTSGAWDTENFLGVYADHVSGSEASRYVSMSAGKSEIYVKYRNATTEKYGLLTLDAQTGAVKYDVELGADTNADGSLGFLNGKLYLVGGGEGEPVCTAIYPDTGAAYWSSEVTLPINAYHGYVTSNGSGFEITGSFSSEAANSEGYEAGLRNEEISVSLSDEGDVTCTVSSKVFFPLADEASDYGLDEGQAFPMMGVAAADGAVIVTGPVRCNEADNMIDTWTYTAQTDRWRAMVGARFAPAALSAVCSCTYGGTYYVLASYTQEEDVYKRFGSFPIAEWGLADEGVTPTSDALCYLDVASQSTTPVTKAGQMTMFSVEATVAEGTTYQWQWSKDGKKWRDCTAKTAQAAELRIYAYGYRAGYQYRCVLSNGDLTAVSDPMGFDDRVVTASCTPAAEVGGTAQLSCAAPMDKGKVTYQWQYRKSTKSSWKDCTAKSMADPTAPKASVAVPAYRAGYQYRCVVTYEDGVVARTLAVDVL